MDPTAQQNQNPPPQTVAEQMRASHLPVTPQEMQIAPPPTRSSFNLKSPLIFVLMIIFIFTAGLTYRYLSSKSTLISKKETALTTSEQKNKKNIIVIDICSARADHFSYNGYFRQTTPNIDKLAAKSTVFTNGWTQSGWCLPNFATMLTGTRPHVNKIITPNSDLSHLDKNLLTIQQILQKAGYSTAGFSGTRWLTKDTFGLVDKGFDIFENPYDVKNAHPMVGMSFANNLPLVNDFLKSQKTSSQPFFLYITVDDLHSPYASPNPNKYDPSYKGILDNIPNDMDQMSDYSIAGGVFDKIYNNSADLNQNDKVTNQLKNAVEEFKKDPKNMEHLIARYDASLNYVDSMVGKVLDELDNDQLMKNSIVIITGHQGEQFGEHNLLGHTESLYEPILRVPFIIYDPETSNGSRRDQLVERIDIPATILDATNQLQSHQNQFTGTSLLPLLKDNNINWKTTIFAESKPPRTQKVTNRDIEEKAVRNKQYKLIWDSNKKDQYQLYDLTADPKETKNLALSLPNVVSELKLELDKNN